MRNSRLFRTLTLISLMLAALASCNVGVGRNVIASLKISPDEAGSRTPSSFPQAATVYVIVRVANARERLKVVCRVYNEQVAGQQTGTEIEGSMREAEVTGGENGYAAFNYSHAGEGWPKGTYRVEVRLLSLSGVEKDQKADTFVVS